MASSSVVDWGSPVKLLLSASYSTFKKNDIPILIDAVIKGESDILAHDDSQDAFYSSVVALSTHYICYSVSALYKSNLSEVASACKVLLKFLLKRLQKDDKCIISQKTLMVLIKSLCKGASSLPKSDVVMITAQLKSAKPPTSAKNTDKDTDTTTSPPSALEARELSRPRLDTGANIYTTLTSVFHELPSPPGSKPTPPGPASPIEKLSADGDMAIIHLSDPLDELTTTFANRNILTLQQLSGGDILLDVCAELTSLRPHAETYRRTLAGDGDLGLTATVMDAMCVRSMLQPLVNDISIVSRVVSLPVIEPLTPGRLHKVVTVTMGCVYAALSAATATTVVTMATGAQVKGMACSKDEELDNAAAAIVQKALEIHTSVSAAIKASTRVASQCLQNFQMLSAWALLKGLQHLVALSPAAIFDKSKEAGAKSAPPTTTTATAATGKTPDTAQTGQKQKDGAANKTSGKSHSGFGMLPVAIATQAISVVTALMEDLALEQMTVTRGEAVITKGAAEPTQKAGPVAMELDGIYSSLERILKLTESVDLTGLLVGLLSTTLKKASSMRKPRARHASDQSSASSSGSTSDSNTYYEDDFSSADDTSDDDDDSEPILGQWFEDTLSPEDATTAPSQDAEGEGAGLEDDDDGERANEKRPTRLSSTDSPCVIPDRRDPEGYVALASDILHFLNTYCWSSPEQEVRNYFRSSMTDAHLSVLATVIRDMDRDFPRLEDGSLAEEFSAELAKFSHNLVANEILSTELQDSLLTHLGVALASTSAPWPLHVYPRTLAVLAEVILLRQQREREGATGATRGRSEGVVVAVWTRFLETLTNAVTGFDNNTKDFPDVNVEHLQLLLLLFHGLPLMHRNPLLVKVALCITRVADAFNSGPLNSLQDHVPLPLSRLMLIMDYLLHYFYDPPAQLMEQIQHNLFSVYTLGSGRVASTSRRDKEISTSTRYFACREVEENYSKQRTGHDHKDGSMTPRFYNLCPAVYSSQGAPKVDGLACSFLLSHPESLSYDDFYAACIQLLAAGTRCDKLNSFSLLDACSVQFHFLVSWRLLSCLPPSLRYLTQLDEGSLPSTDPHLLHTLRWAPRLANKTFKAWTKDLVVKQGVVSKQADTLLNSVADKTNTVTYDIKLAVHFIQHKIAVMPLASPGQILSPSDLPSLATVYMLDAMLAKIQVSLDDLFSKSDVDQAMSVAQDLLPGIFMLIEAYTTYIRSCLLNQVSSVASITMTTPTNAPTPPTTTEPGAELSTPQATLSNATLAAYGTILSIGSSRTSKLSTLGLTLIGLLPGGVRSVVEKWGCQVLTEFPAVGAWRNAFANDLIPVESYMDAIQTSHLATLSSQSKFTLNSSLKHVLHGLVRFCGDLIIWCPGEASSNEMVRILFPLVFDASTEYLAEFVLSSLERVLGTVDSEAFVAKIYDHAITICHDLMVNHDAHDSVLDECVLHKCLNFMENHLHKPGSKEAMERFFTTKADLVAILLSAANENLSLAFGTAVLAFFNKLFLLAEKDPSDRSYQALCASLGRLAQLEPAVLQNWLSRMIMGGSQNSDDQTKIQENRLLLLSLTSYIVKERSHVTESVATAILSALIPMGAQILAPSSEGIGFSELMVVMATLAGAGSGAGHAALFTAATGWLEMCKNYLTQKNVLEKIEENVTSGKHQTMLESARYLLSYVADILSALKQLTERAGVTSPPYEGDVCIQEADSDWADDLAPEEDDSMAEDSDEESLNSKLCTFTITQREYMNQHWYHCHTCKMVDGIGVCSVCAKVCHKDHDLSYAKFGSFFCDCGAKEDNTCQALVKRSSASGLDSSSAHPSGPAPFSMETMLTSSLRRRLSSPGATSGERTEAGRRESEQVSKARETLCKQITSCKDALVASLTSSRTLDTVLELVRSLMPTISQTYESVSPLGSTLRAQRALETLKTTPKTTETTDQLMTATLGSQEGAFENVKMSYHGDQGQTIRQLISSHVLRRVAMCCLASPLGKRQHLAVSHEKGKVTILQLSALLKQADSSKRKLTLTRLASAPIPFTVLSIAGNPCNEDFLAVCGLKDCHVLTFTSSGSVADHLVLHPSLETGNFIIKALWLPGSQTDLAIVTADFVKIYTLASDAISPAYYFLLPSGKIRDATFVFSDRKQQLVLMSSAGYIYTQTMDEVSSAQHGPFYITNTMEVPHPDIKETNGQVGGGGVSVYYSHALQLLLYETNGQVGGGGVSVYYSHALQLLFFSYTQGKSFAAAVSTETDELQQLFPISFKSSNGNKGSNSQPLVQWMEVANHPGLVVCMTQTSNNPIVLMVRPEVILVQEIRVLPAKAKIQDVVAIHHSGSNADQRTTLILLCEDGSLRIYMANTEQTSHWMMPSLQPTSAITVLKPARKKKVVKAGKPAGQVTFPVDFFEHAQHTNDIEFGGNDVLQVYNTAQVKNRLNTAGMYIASTKPGGFALDLTNTAAAMVMVGVRVLVGSQSVERGPTYLEVFGRASPVTLTRARWVDLPFTREESLTADKKVTLFVGGSSDPAGVTMIDSIKVYVKTKEALGWPEDQEDFPEASGAPKVPVAVTTPGFTVTETESSAVTPQPLTALDKLLASALEVLDGCFSSVIQTEDKDPVRQATLDLSTRLLNLPMQVTVQQHTKTLMAALFHGRASYHQHRDGAQLSHVVHSLPAVCDAAHQGEPPGRAATYDAEAFQHLVLIVRNVAINRPGNLLKYAEVEPGQAADDTTDAAQSYLTFDPSELRHFTVQLTETFWRLHAMRPANPFIAPVCLPGLMHIDTTVGALVEIVHAFTTCNLDSVGLAVKVYLKLLLSEHTQISFACKQALIRVLRPRHKRKRVFIPSPPRCSTPGAAAEDEEDDGSKPTGDAMDTPHQEAPPPLEPLAPPPLGHQAPPPLQPQAPPPDDDALYEIVGDDLAAPGLQMPAAASLEALLGGGGGQHFPPMLDLPPDADDETMVELAIALSLQDQEGQGASALGLQGFNLGGQAQAAALEGGHLSDTTASGPGSDDEAGSTAATVGSGLHTSPAQHGSESGGSNVDSVSVSGRSSAYGDSAPEAPLTSARSESGSVGPGGGATAGPEEPSEGDSAHTLHTLRILLLARLTEYLPELRKLGGLRAIPVMQVVLMLTSDLDSEEEADKSTLDALLAALITELQLTTNQDAPSRSADPARPTPLSSRSDEHEVQLVIMRLLSVLMSRTKVCTKAASEASSSFLSTTTSLAMLQRGGLAYCLSTLTALLDFWKKSAPEEAEGSVVPGQLLKPHPTTPPPDMSPFFLRQYVKSHATDVFEDYPRLLTEMVLRLPYQMKKIAESVSGASSPTFDQSWFHILAEYLMTQQAPFVRRQVRKLLLYICGSKDKYRQLRDIHTLETHMAKVRELAAPADISTDAGPVILQYDILITLMDHLKSCSEVATARTINWQKFCQKDESVLPFLVRASIALDSGVAPTLLQLLQSALCGSKATASATGEKASPSKASKRDKDKNKEEEQLREEETLWSALVQQVSRSVDRSLLTRFIRTFLLESNASSVRWQAHGLVLQLYQNSSPAQTSVLLHLMWEVWPELPAYGRKAAQFVDLLGYFAIKTPQAEDKARQYVEKAVSVLRGQNKILAAHPNGSVYNMLQGLVDFDGFYLESDPCLVCNNPEVPFSNIKLSAIKVDSKFTTTTQIVKLVGSHTISRIMVRLSDVKRTKMVRTMNFYYNNRTVQAVVELKNKPGLWHRAKKVVLTTGQTEVKVEFPLPIVACNLMVEYADFYDNLQASTETLQCPRCSASVPANPGVCGNCGENVFQCHKCRAINYDEKDPFLCNACGFCKYAKFDLTLTARVCCAVDPIENDDDRKKAVSTINTLLEKADRLYKQLQHNKPALEALLVKVSEHGTDRPQFDDAPVTPPSSAPGAAPSSREPAVSVNRAIYQLAQRYCTDCRNTFDELSKIVQKVLVSRRELVEYDRQQREAAITAAAALPVSAPTTPTISPRDSDSLRRAEGEAYKGKERLSRCYGCASATVEHCITLLRALCTNTSLRTYLCSQGLLRELLEYNLRRGASGVRNDVRHLLCQLTTDDARATDQLNALILDRVTGAIRGHMANLDFAGSVRHEILLLASTIHLDDQCWETRVRAVLKLFLYSMKVRSPAVLECVALPCLRTIQHLLHPPAPTTKKNKDKPVESLSSVSSGSAAVHVDVTGWLEGRQEMSYSAWRDSVPARAIESAPPAKKKKEVTPDPRPVVRARFLSEKYGTRWRQAVLARRGRLAGLRLVDRTWLRQAMFSPSSSAARQTACSIAESLCVGSTGRKKDVIDMLTGYLDEIGRSGEGSSEFLALYKRLISTGHWKYYLAVRGVLTRIGALLTKEIEELSTLEDLTLTSDLSQGYALKALTELLASFVEQDTLKQHYKSRLVGTVLNGYLSLRRLVVQRTKLIDDTQDKLLELLEEMTTGTESETKEFMSVCVQTLDKYPLSDFLSPVFIFERLCSIIYPEENDVGEFFLTLEKDPQQEDFLQGRMLGNPYSSNEPGLGPLMRDVKNKICQDCELVALLEDDTGMELLVCNKIISLDLPVKDVYKKVWCAQHGEGDAMRVVYRMRGLLGDATEDMVNSLDTGKDEDVDNEEVYKMAAVMSQNRGLQVILQRLASIRDLVTGKQLMQVLLKLLSFCVKVKVNRIQLLRPEMNTVSIMLGALNLALLAEQEGGVSTKGQTLTEQILQLMETILQEASQQAPELYKEFSKLCGDTDQLRVLLDRINSPFVRANAAVLQVLMRLIPFLAFGDPDKMLALVNHFRPYVDFNKFDLEHSHDDQVHLDCFCVIALGIENNANGKKLKDLILERGIVHDCVDYIKTHAPEIRTMLATDSENWKEFISKPALPYVLRILTGLSKGHDEVQVLLSQSVIPIVHKLEQVSSDEHVGTLAENLMEAIKEHQQVAKKVEEVRQETKAEKKRLAMAMRKKQLGALGMQTNDKGQVTVKSSVLERMEELKEETGLICCICREGYRYQPNKVLGIYTFTKRVNVEDFELKPRKTIGYSTVSHFNTVHVDCHLAAVRHARGREEWESAALQNANTKCNGLLPLWGPQVPESAFANCLARHNTCLQECTGVRDVTFTFTTHDVKQLLLRFSLDRSFSQDSGGGGRESNIQLLPHMVHMALYVINTTRSVTREEKNVATFLKAAPDKWLESCYETEGCVYWVTMATQILDRDRWKEARVAMVRRLIVTAHVRHVMAGGGQSVADKTPKDFAVYKPYLLFFGLADGMQNILFKRCSLGSESSWAAALASYVRHSDTALQEAAKRLLGYYEQEVAPCETFLEICDVMGLLEEIPNPDTFIGDAIAALP